MILSITAYLPSVYSPGASFQSNFGTTVGLSWGTQGPKDLTETDSTISRPWNSPNPDNPLTAGNGRQRNRSLFLQFSQREVKQMSITHSLTQYPAGQLALFRGWTSKDGETVEEWHSVASEMSSIWQYRSWEPPLRCSGWYETLTNLRWCMKSNVKSIVFM